MLPFITTHVETTGFDQVYRVINEHQKSMSPRRLGDAALAGAKKAAELIETEMMQPKSGIKWANLPDRSASPAEMPAVQSGELIAKMEENRLSSNMYQGVAELVASSRQAWFQEFGFMTRDGGFHIRPWMRPSVDKNRGAIQFAMKSELAKG